MRTGHTRRFWRREREHTEMIAMALSDGAKTLADIEDSFYAFGRRAGLFLEAGRHEGELAGELAHEIEAMIAEGWVELHDGRYTLTDQGQSEANLRLSGMRQFGLLIREALQPQTVTRVAVAVHLFLAAVKLPAGLLSGSMGLLNDAADTLLDGLSSVLAHWGIRLGKERAANVLLVLLMLGTGSLTLTKAVRRLLAPRGPEVDAYAFAAILLSGLLCAGLGAYQRYVGLKSSSLMLITQSVDSRNHVLVALGVTVGLAASRLGVGVVDAVVGVGVALLILKSGVEVAVEVVRSTGQEKADLSRYTPGVVERFARLRQAQLRDWMLYLVDKGVAQTRGELLEQARRGLEFGRYPALRELGLAGQPRADEMIARSLCELDERAWIQGEARLVVTDAGREHLHLEMQHPRRAMRRSWHMQQRDEES